MLIPNVSFALHVPLDVHTSCTSLARCPRLSSLFVFFFFCFAFLPPSQSQSGGHFFPLPLPLSSPRPPCRYDSNTVQCSGVQVDEAAPHAVCADRRPLPPLAARCRSSTCRRPDLSMHPLTIHLVTALLTPSLSSCPSNVALSRSSAADRSRPSPPSGRVRGPPAQAQPSGAVAQQLLHGRQVSRMLPDVSAQRGRWRSDAERGRTLMQR